VANPKQAKFPRVIYWPIGHSVGQHWDALSPEPVRDVRLLNVLDVEFRFHKFWLLQLRYADTEPHGEHLCT
jgi:hypothetical protein